MSGPTELPRAQSRFPTTRWSRLLAPGGDTEARKAAWSELASAYWRPVFAYVRTRWARNDEEALDATQEFFLWMLSRDFLERADPDRGRFRGLVKASLANFMRDLERKQRTLKRGGERSFVSIGGGSWATAEEDLPQLDPADTRKKSPDEVLDDVWRAEVLSRATAALEQELVSQGKVRTFRVFQEYFLADGEVDYAGLAERHGMKRSDVSNHLQAAKRRFRAVLKATVAETVGDRADLEAELAWLLGRGGP